MPIVLFTLARVRAGSRQLGATRADSPTRAIRAEPSAKRGLPFTWFLPGARLGRRAHAQVNGSLHNKGNTTEARYTRAALLSALVALA